MKRCFFSLILIGSLGLTGCNFNDHAHHQESAESDASHDIHQSHETHASHLPLLLNDGAKWSMDEHTRQVSSKMLQQVRSLDLASLDQPALLQLGMDLQADLSRLIQGCTMTGPAHDQLHVFLGQLMPAVDRLKSQGELGAAKAVSELLENQGLFFE